MKSTQVQTLSEGHALVYTEHLVGNEDARHYDREELNLCVQLARSYWR